ncbi:unnamed protein product [Blepharisma stoltei]|uniref:Protein kinase domain-containing protein n=1 Tax=Blepharisma stoltei TaxID=1481888 RepID=A0AAU9IWA2_9CILI|nr:unnamed protein product [Blepharisma stoltei]
MISIFEETDIKVNGCSSFWHSIDERWLEDIKENKIYEGSLRLPASNSIGKERHFVLTKTSIYSMNKKNSRSPQLMSKINWKLVEPFIEHNTGDERYGFKIFQNKIFQDFYAKNSDDLDSWLHHLSYVSIMTDLEDDYSIIREVGKGSFANVFLSQDLDNDEKYAIKAISKSKSFKDAYNSIGMINEIEVMRKVKHPYILTLHKIYESENHVYLVLDYVEGGELLQRLMTHGKIPESSAVKFCANLLDALDYLHSMNIMHRDIKPENILMVERGNDFEFKISDFGLALQTEEKQDLRCGSPGYVAPEILRKEPYDKRIDAFSAGILMFVILSGRTPFPGKDTKEILSRNKECMIHYQSKYWSDVSMKAIDLIQRLTDPNPNFRISISDAKQHPWVSFLFRNKKNQQFPKQQEGQLRERYAAPNSENSSMIKVSHRVHNDKRREQGTATERSGRTAQSLFEVAINKHKKIVSPSIRAKMAISVGQ